jgi:hypothetical protein
MVSVIRLCVVAAALLLGLAAPAGAAPECAFRLSILVGGEEGVEASTAHAIAARYVEVLKDDIVFAPSQTEELRLTAGALVADVPAVLAVTANRGCSADLLADVERIAASARERWRERVWRYDEPGQGLNLEIAVTMQP